MSFEIEEMKKRFFNMTEFAKKEMLINFDRSLLVNSEIIEFLKEISSNDESFSVRYFAKKLITLSSNPQNYKSHVFIDNNENIKDSKLMSLPEKMLFQKTKENSKMETLFINGEALELDFSNVETNIENNLDKRAFSFFLDLFPYVIFFILLFRFMNIPLNYLLPNNYNLWVYTSIIIGITMFKDVIFISNGIGKAALGIEIEVYKNSMPAGILRKIFRNITMISPLFIIEFLFLVFFSKDGRRIGDYIAGTKVKVRNKSNLSTISLLIVYVCYFFVFFYIMNSSFSLFGKLNEKKFKSVKVHKNSAKRISFYKLKFTVNEKWSVSENSSKFIKLYFENINDGVSVIISRVQIPYLKDLKNNKKTDLYVLKTLENGTRRAIQDEDFVDGSLNSTVTNINGVKAFKIEFLLKPNSFKDFFQKTESYFFINETGEIYTITLTRQDNMQFDIICDQFMQSIEFKYNSRASNNARELYEDI